MTDALQYNTIVRFRGCTLGFLGRGRVIKPVTNDGRVLVEWPGGCTSRVRRDSIEVAPALR